jgi:hypothetical protein
MTAPGQDPAAPGLAASLATVRTGLDAAERAMRAGEELDLAPLEAQIRTLCERSTMLQGDARREAADELDRVLARLGELETALAASVLR